MPFLINNTVIEFENYKSLVTFSVSHPFVKDILLFLNDWYDEELNQIMVNTSGSTGKPKQIKLSKLSMIKSALKTQAYFHYKSGDKCMLCLPAKYIAGKMMLVRSIVSKLTLILVEPCDNPLAKISDNIDFIPMTPYQFIKSAEQNIDQINLVDKILLGGGPVNSKVIEVLTKIKSKLYHGFGMTETITHIAVKLLSSSHTIPYVALEGVRFAADQNDCLVIDANHLSSKIYTTDIVELIDETSFNWIGRLDNVINSAGIKLHPEAIELKIKKIISSRYFLFGQKHESLGERMVLILEANPALDLQQLKKGMTKVLSKYEIPKEIFIVDYILTTETGKMKREETFELALKNN